MQLSVHGQAVELVAAKHRQSGAHGFRANRCRLSLSLSIPCVTLETAPLAARVRTSQVRSVVDTMADEHSRCDSSAKLCLSSETEHWPTSLGRAAIVEFSPSTSLPGVGWRDPRAGGVSTCAEFRF
jgi:hypothetical protein